MSFKVPDRLLTDGQCRMMINGIQFINSKIWIGKAVTRACHYANYGNKDGNPAIVFGSCGYNNMIDQLIKNDPDKNPKGWFTYHKDEGEGDYYTANIIKTGFDNWING